MGIIKEKPTNFGITASYHKLDRVEIDTKNSEVIIYLASYPNEEARSAASSPLSIERVVIPFWRLKQDPRALFYNMVIDYDRSPVYGGTGDISSQPYDFKIEVEPTPDPMVPRSL